MFINSQIFGDFFREFPIIDFCYNSFAVRGHAFHDWDPCKLVETCLMAYNFPDKYPHVQMRRVCVWLLLIGVFYEYQ